MFTNTKTGAKVRLTAQDEKSVCHFTDEAGHRHTLPSHVFFAAYAAPAVDVDQAEPPKRVAPKPAPRPRAAAPKKKAAAPKPAPKPQREHVPGPKRVAAEGDKPADGEKKD